jgi:hypothetical protein
MIELKGAGGILQHQTDIGQTGRGAHGAHERLDILETAHTRPRASSCDALPARDCLALPPSRAYLGSHTTHETL